jgi:hypothetical protein
LHSDVPCQLHDWNGDGRSEVVIATRDHVIVFDGADGRELWRFSTPDPEAADCLVFCRLSGNERDDVLLKDRYHRLWAYTWDGRLLWQVTDPGGYKTAHQPVPLDLDGDGRDAIFAGYALLGHDGTVRWTLDGDLGRGHLDCVRVLRRGATPGAWRFALTACGDNAIVCVDGHGRTVWAHHGRHFESIRVGAYRPGGVQLVVDIDHADPGQGPLLLYDADGVWLGDIGTVYSRHHPVVHWDASGLARIVACEDRLLVSGETGVPLARFATPLPDGVAFLQAQRNTEHARRGAFHLLGHAGNLFGAGRDDLLLCTNPGGAVWLYRNTAGPAAGAALGTRSNVTLY